MKNGKKPNVRQLRFIESKGLDNTKWLVVKDTPQEMVLVHRHSDKTTRVIPKD